MTIGIRRRDPAVIAARAHAVLDAVARAYAQWPEEGRDVIGRDFLRLHVALAVYQAGAGAEGAAGAAENAAPAMTLLLLSVALFLGEDAAEQMTRDTSGVTA